MSTISTKIQTVAEDGIKRAAQDGQSVEQHSIPDLIAADRHIKNEAAKRAPGFPVRRFKTKPPGAVS